MSLSVFEAMTIFICDDSEWRMFRESVWGVDGLIRSSVAVTGQFYLLYFRVFSFFSYG